MTAIKAPADRRLHPESMLQGYELFLVDRQGRRHFRAATARNATEVMHQARQALQEQDVASVEVRMAGEHLFTLQR